MDAGLSNQSGPRAVGLNVTSVAAASVDLRPPGPGGLRGPLRYNPGLPVQVRNPDVQNQDVQQQAAQDQDRAAIDVARLARVAAQDAAALSELYDAHSRLLFGVICRIVKDRAEAEEILQEVFVQAWRRAATYDRSLGSPAGWLLGIARNRAIDRLRANAVRTRTIDALEPPAAIETPEGTAALSERQRDVQRALASLPDDQRTLIEDAYFLGLTQSELAARFRLPLGTVKTRMRAGLQALRRQLDARQLEP